MTGRISIAQIARESGVDYFRVWKVTASAGGWDGLTKDEAERLIAVLEKHDLGDEATTVSPKSTPTVWDRLGDAIRNDSAAKFVSRDSATCAGLHSCSLLTRSRSRPSRASRPTKQLATVP